MLVNYQQLPNGVIKQLTYNKITYDSDYSAKYNAYGEKANYISYLRLGGLLGIIKETPLRILDVGYGNGAFLNAAKQCIPYCAGCDLSPYPVPEGCEKVDSLTSAAYDVVCFFDSLEHFDDITIVKELNTRYVYISVPWCHYVSDEWFENWYHRRPNEHLWHFSEPALKAFFDECGYDCIYTGCMEDTIRKNPAQLPLPNILTGVFKKR